MPFFVSAGVCESDTVTDIEGNAYNTVEIGNQCWMQENLNVGTPIGSFESDGTTLNPQTDNATIEKYCYGYSTHGDAGQLATGEANCDTYGGLYQWDEMMQYETQEGTQGICPAGWHIPSDDEWKTLEMHLGMTQAQADITAGEERTKEINSKSFQSAREERTVQCRTLKDSSPATAIPPARSTISACSRTPGPRLSQAPLPGDGICFPGIAPCTAVRVLRLTVSQFVVSKTSLPSSLLKIRLQKITQPLHFLEQ